MSNSGGGFSVTRTHPGDRFYNPPPLRRQHQLQHQLLLEQQQQQQQQRRVAAAAAPPKYNKQENRVGSSVELQPRVNSDDSTLSSTNLDRLMESVTPRVPSQVKTRGTRNREAADDDVLPFFALGDLWESYSEWSAYGAGVPLNINGSDSVTQYYVPFLSGMQIYVDKNRPRYFLFQKFV